MSYTRIAGSGAAEAFIVGVDQSFKQTLQGNVLRGNVNAAFARGGRGGWLGGSRSQYVESASEILVPEYWPVYIDWRHTGGDAAAKKLSVIARVEVITLNAGTSVTARVKNLTEATNHDATPSTSTSWVEKLITIPAPSVPAVQKYQLYIFGNNATNGIAALGEIEIYDALF